MTGIVILKTGTAIAGIPPEWGDFEHWIADAGGLQPGQWRCCDVSGGEALPAFEGLDAVIVTGSPAMVTDRHPWSERSASWLSSVVSRQVPVLGICYGHQLLAHALGGLVGNHPLGREIGTAQIKAQPAAANDELFGELPAVWPAHVTHSQTVLALPPGAVVLGGNAFEPHHAVRFAPKAWGVQFHPEFTPQIMDRYLELRAAVLKEEGMDVEALRGEVRPTPEAGALLRAFIALVTSRPRSQQAESR